ncbi:MAG TPA: carbohydrate ABC transporter permease, partial [Clostridiales bacterium]|nr:carbohydrate ABC transporter permease [Clostridiales bacterium]
MMSAARAKKQIKETLTVLLLVFLAFIFVTPFLWMLSTSIKPDTLIFRIPPIWIPETIMWENYAEVFNRIPLFTYLKNTLITSVLPVIGQLLSAPMIAYGLTKIP